MLDLPAILSHVRIVPVLTINRLSDALPLATALRDGGLPVLEITLRTEASLDALEAICRSLDGVTAGAGTVLNVAQLKLAVDAGSRFIVTPGLTANVVAAARDCDIALMPGISTASDLMRGLELGVELFKFFPAEAAGGVNTLRALAGPFPQVRFCPTGGVNLSNITEYLALPNVIAVGGSWMVSARLDSPRDFTEVRDAALASRSRI